MVADDVVCFCSGMRLTTRAFGRRHSHAAADADLDCWAFAQWRRVRRLVRCVVVLEGHDLPLCVLGRTKPSPCPAHRELTVLSFSRLDTENIVPPAGYTEGMLTGNAPPGSIGDEATKWTPFYQTYCQAKNKPCMCAAPVLVFCKSEDADPALACTGFQPLARRTTPTPRARARRRSISRRPGGSRR